MSSNSISRTRARASKMDHESLVEEMKFLDKIPVPERAALAKMRRQFQLDNYTNWNAKENSTGTEIRPSKIRFSPQIRLFEAVTKGDQTEFKELMDVGVDPNVRNYEDLTPLHQACIEGHREMVEILLERGAHVNAADSDGWTPLHAAATCGHQEIVKLLVRSGADLLASNSDEDMPFEITEDEEIQTFLEREMVYQGITEKMVTERRKITHSLLKNEIMNALRAGANLNTSVTPNGATFLHVTLSNFYNDLVKTLLTNGADDGATDDEGWKPIHVAAYWGNEEGFKLLIKHSQPDLQIKTPTGDTPYDLCDDHDLKVYIRGLLNKNLSSNPSPSQNNSSDLDFLNLHHMIEERDKDSKEREIQKLNSYSVKFRRGSMENNKPADLRRVSAEDIRTMVPLFNPGASEMASERRTSFKETKKYGSYRKSTITDKEIGSPEVTERPFGLKTIGKAQLEETETSDLPKVSPSVEKASKLENQNPFLSYNDNNNNLNHKLNVEDKGLTTSNTNPKNKLLNKKEDPPSYSQLHSLQQPFNSLPRGSQKSTLDSSNNNTYTLSTLKKQRLADRKLNGNSKRFSQIDDANRNENSINNLKLNNFSEIKYHFVETPYELGPSIVKKKKKCIIM